MNLKNKIAANFSLLFSVFLGIILFSIYVLFYRFRKDEFLDILKDRVITTASFFQNKSKDEIIDLNIVNSVRTYSLQQEEILVFNKDFNLLYSNVKDKKINWNKDDLLLLKKNKEIYRSVNGTGIYGIKKGENYYLIQAIDVIGDRILEFMRTMMFVVFLVASSLVWISSFLFAKRMISPLDDFQKRITNISVNNLNEKLPETNRKDEINLLAKVFNTMLERIQKSFIAEKEFTASASHEIKTPLTRMAFQLENLSKITEKKEEKEYIDGIQKEVFHLSDTVNSLLILSKIEDQREEHIEDVRMDEVIFEAYEIVKRNYPEFEIDFNIHNYEGNLTIKGIKSLLKIVYINIFKNAVLYSWEPKAEVDISESITNIEVKIKSKGNPISAEDQKKIFEAFRRGNNTQNKTGSGLGLRIAKRILDFHSAKISYQFTKDQRNQFLVSFPKF